MKMFGKDHKNKSIIGWEICNFDLENVGKWLWIYKNE